MSPNLIVIVAGLGLIIFGGLVWVLRHDDTGENTIELLGLTARLLPLLPPLIAFVCGYGVREWISQRRRAAARQERELMSRRSYPAGTEESYRIDAEKEPIAQSESPNHEQELTSGLEASPTASDLSPSDLNLASSSEAANILEAAVAGVPEVAQIIASIPPQNWPSAFDAAERSYLQTARDLGGSETFARNWTAAIISRLRAEVEAQVLLNRKDKRLN